MKGIHRVPSLNYRGIAGKQVYVRYATYRELKKHIKEHFDRMHITNYYVHVTRYKRGQWGEWFEIWGMNSKNKIYKVREGWM